MMNINWKFSIIVAVISVLIYVLLVKVFELRLRRIEDVNTINDSLMTVEAVMLLSVFIGYNVSDKYLSGMY